MELVTKAIITTTLVMTLLSCKTGSSRTVERERRFREYRQGCLFGFVVDAATAEKAMETGWEPTDQVVADFEKEFAASDFALSDAYGRQYWGRKPNELRVTFFCAGASFDYAKEVDTEVGGRCSRHLDYFVAEKKLKPIFYGDWK